MTDSPDPHDDPTGLPAGGFLASFPWWVVVTRHQPGVEPGAVRLGPDSGFLVLDAFDGTTSVAVFTDQDLADRFVRAAAFPGVPAAVDEPRQFLGLLRYLPPVCTHAAFDPPARVGARARWVVPLDRVRTALDLIDPPDTPD